MLAAAKADTASPGEVGEAYFYLAQKQLVANDRAAAMTNFRHVGEILGYSNVERVAAERELAHPAGVAAQ